MNIRFNQIPGPHLNAIEPEGPPGTCGKTHIPDSSRGSIKSMARSTCGHAAHTLIQEHKPPREQARLLGVSLLGVRAGGTPHCFQKQCVRRQDRKARELTCTGWSAKSLSSEKKRTKPINEKQWSNTLVGELLSRCHWHWYVQLACQTPTQPNTTS